jgi:hypothetical protein
VQHIVAAIHAPPQPEPLASVRFGARVCVARINRTLAIDLKAHTCSPSVAADLAQVLDDLVTIDGNSQCAKPILPTAANPCVNVPSTSTKRQRKQVLEAVTAGRNA